MSGIEQGLLELAELPNDDWAYTLVVAGAFRHVQASASCRGYTITCAGRALCSACDWQLSGRMEDVGEKRSARFAMFALAALGAAVAAAWEPTFKTIIEADTEGEALQKALAEFRAQYPDTEIEDITIRQVTADEDAS